MNGSGFVSTANAAGRIEAGLPSGSPASWRFSAYGISCSSPTGIAPSERPFR
jgi:hypothetical protein